MKLIRSEDLARTAPARWHHTYSKLSFGEDKRTIDAALQALRLEERTPERIEQIIGNDTWTQVYCHECSTSRRRAIQFGSDEDSDGLAYICHDCLFAALALIEGR